MRRRWARLRMRRDAKTRKGDEQASLEYSPLAGMRSFVLGAGLFAASLSPLGAEAEVITGVCPDGSVYVSDAGLDDALAPTGTDAIWRIGPDDEVSALFQGEALGQPTAISAQRAGVYAVSWASGVFFEVDYRGSLGYGRDFRAGVHMHLGGNDLQDELAGVDGERHAAQEYVDLVGQLEPQIMRETRESILAVCSAMAPRCIYALADRRDDV